MAQSGTRSTSISFGSFELAASLVKANGSRDLKTCYVDETGAKVTAGGSRGGRAGLEKAVEVGGRFVRLPAEELEAIEQASKDAFGSMRVLECIDYRQVPTERIAGSYWLQPAQGSAQGLFLLHKALADRDKIAVVKWVSTSREKLGVIRPRMVRRQGGYHRALLLSELTHANDFAVPDADVLAINEAEHMLEQADGPAFTRAVEAARELIDAFTRQPGDPKAIDTASDTAVDARLALLERLQGEALTAGLEASLAGADVVPLTSALARKAVA
jgi:non-homologous end joining protein Ku